MSESVKRGEGITVLAAAPAAVFLFVPLLVYLTNMAAVDIPKTMILVWGSFFTLICMSLLLLIARPGRARNGVLRFSGVVVFLVFILAVFPNQTGEFSGFDDRASTQINLVAVTKLLLLLLAGLTWSGRRPGQFAGVAKVLAVVLLAACLGVSLLFNSAADAIPGQGQAPAGTFHELGRESNILVIVLDGFTGYRLQEVLDAEPGLKKSFAGFRYFPLALAPAFNTSAGTSLILTGGLQDAIEEQEWTARNTRSLESSFLARARGQGYEVSFISPLLLHDSSFEAADEQKFFAQPALLSTASLNAYLSFWVTSMTRVLPAFFSARLEDMVQSLVTQSLPDDGDTYAHLLRTLNHDARAPIKGKLAFDYFAARLSVGKGPRKAIFLHSKLTHSPWNFDQHGKVVNGAGWKESSVYFVRRVADLLDRLRELQSYGNSLIIITSDHGSIPLEDPRMGGALDHGSRAFRPLNPLLLVKPVGAAQPLQFSTHIAWLGDIAATVDDHLGLAREGEGEWAGVSLLRELEPGRELDIPLFFKPRRDFPSHSALALWQRVDVRGQIRHFGAAARERPDLLLQFPGDLQLKVGDMASISLNGKTLLISNRPGITVLGRDGGRTALKHFANHRAGLEYLAAAGRPELIVAVGQGVPASDLAEWPWGVRGGPKAADLRHNLVFARGSLSQPRELVQTGPGELIASIKWMGAEPSD